MNDLLGTGIIFQLELKDKSYLLRARTLHQAEQWITVLNKIKEQAQGPTVAVPAAVAPRIPSSTKLNPEKKSDKTPPPAPQKKACCVIS